LILLVTRASLERRKVKAAHPEAVEATAQVAVVVAAVAVVVPIVQAAQKMNLMTNPKPKG